MKKFLFYLFILPLVFIACNDDKKTSGTTTSADTTKMAGDTAKEALTAKKLRDIDVKRLHDNYVRFVTADPTKMIQVINYSTPCIQKYIRTGEGGSFIMGAEDDKTIVIILEIYHEMTQTSDYYYLDKVMENCSTGMRQRPVLCPPPTPCDLPIITPAKTTE